MSYCRWSTNDFQCDLYCYESDAGFVTHVAGNRIVFTETLPEDIDWGAEDFAMQYVDRWNKVSDIIAKSNREEITLPHAGETFTDHTLEEFKQRVQMLKGIGYQVPDDVFERIDEEIRDNSGADTN